MYGKSVPHMPAPFHSLWCGKFGTLYSSELLVEFGFSTNKSFFYPPVSINLDEMKKGGEILRERERGYYERVACDMK